MTTLRLVLEPRGSGSAPVLDRPTAELARALVRAAPRECDVAAVTPSLPPEVAHALTAEVPGLAAVDAQVVRARELAAAWRLGIVGNAASGLVHSPSLLAPLRPHQRDEGHQTTVTVDDTIAWRHPSWLPKSTVLWRRAMLRRARRYADAIVVPSHAVADELAEIVELGERVRVIPPAGRSGLVVPDDAVERATRLALPSEFAVTTAGVDPRADLEALVSGLSASRRSLPLLVIGASPADEETPEWLRDARPGTVRFLGDLSDADRATVLVRAAVFVHPWLEDSRGTDLLDALAIGTPSVYSAAPGLVELAGEAGVAVDPGDAASYPERLAFAVQSVLDDTALRDRLRVAGSDRARLFSWRSCAEAIWRLHAEL